MTLIMGIQVLSRYVLGQSLSWSEEITRYLFIWSGFLSVSYCSKKCLSIKIEQFVAIFPRRGKALFKVVNHTFELIFFLYMIPFAASTAFSSSRCCSPAAAAYHWCTAGLCIDSERDRCGYLCFIYKESDDVGVNEFHCLPMVFRLIHPSSFFLHCYPQKPPEYHHLAHIRWWYPEVLFCFFMILNLFCSNRFQSYTKRITITYVPDSFCFYSLCT